VTSWRIAADLRIHEWDGSAVVYDPASGDTHCLDPVLTAVLSRLAAGDAGEEALSPAIASVLNVPLAAAREYLVVAMAELERMKLTVQE
jgi:PqqD family protein of HPr-rel-A system